MDALCLRAVDNFRHHQGHVEGGWRQVRAAADGREHQQDQLFDMHFSSGVFPDIRHRRRFAGCQQPADVQLSDQQQNHERMLQRLRKHGVLKTAADPRERAGFKPDLQQQAVRGGNAHKWGDQELLVDDQEDRVHHLVMEIRILKKFLSMFGQGLEDFRLEVYPSARKMLLHGFNRQELLSQKNASLATQPMSLSMQLSLNDMVEENTLPGDEKHTVAFRLRDFRTFVQLAGAESGECSIKFSYEGSPIVFERRIARREHEQREMCVFTLTMISDSEAIEAAPFAEPAKQPRSAESLFVSEPAEATAPAQIVWNNEPRDTATEDRPRSPPATAREIDPRPEQLPFDPDQLDPTQVPIAKGLFD
ncbi:hypothetical protein KL948_000101 [Ogataea haglerorum]|nr:hypothetical protein KL914_000101 [Ogataea haglerorum]KAG7734535.1 hypothetical protein KL948_000101 [Ogataea haglerorum]KAG7761495.1 hypothetical protein KL947_000443 [Ogataea haglerorum]KAG7815582.1 hypothetical protein KL924_000668 [Ogataea haglerorum]